MKFELESEDTRTISLADPKANIDAAAAGACLTALVESGDAFADPLKKGLRAELIERNVTVLVDNE